MNIGPILFSYVNTKFSIYVTKTTLNSSDAKMLELFRITDDTSDKMLELS